MSQPSILGRVLRAVSPRRDAALPALPGQANEPRIDGLANVLSGLGVEGQDKSMSSRPAPHLPLSRVELGDLYESDDVARRIVDAVPADCTRRGWEVQVDTGDDVADPFSPLWEDVNLAGAMEEADAWARLYGGAAVILGVDDGTLDATEPVDASRFRGLRFAMAVDRHELMPAAWQMDPALPGFGLPSMYTLSLRDGRMAPESMRTIHASRVMRFEGARLPRERRALQDYWGAPVLDAVWTVLQAYSAALQGMAHIAHEYELKVLGVKDLRGMAGTEGGRQKIMERVILFRQGLGIAKLAMIDADGETLSRMSASVAGLADLYDRFAMALAGAADMPMSRLFGQGPSGFAADDVAGARWYYDRVAARQRRQYAPHLRRLAQLYVDGRVVDVPADASITIAFRPLAEPTDKERAETRHTDAQADEIHWRLGAIDEIEVRTSAYSGAGYSSDRRLMTAQERQQLAPDAPAATAPATPPAGPDA